MTRLLITSCLILIAVSLLFAQTSAVRQPSATVNLTGPALLRAEGKSIKINGVVAATPTLIFPGDKVETGGDTAAYLVRPGKTWTLDRNSSAEFQDGALVPSQGRVWVSNEGQPVQQLGSRILDVNAAESDFNDDGCRQIPRKGQKACDEAENECQSKYKKECLCHYDNPNHNSPINPEPSDFKCRPL